ncbi:uncharacterized protein LOC106132056 [Amyelois transitella]|uniref:uncharacterized protein LOC106132056 n=1 Tax=Amyelois transitella TaxID=680683 RepID=UPI00067BE686|nr:uncharacterized protein LOC106132056 [Amyelois transitella]
MENKQTSSKKKLISIREEKLIREVNYDGLVGASPRLSKKELLLDLEILKKGQSRHPALQRVLVSIKPRQVPAIKTLYIAEKSRYYNKKSSKRSGSRLAIGDHSSFVTRYSEDDSDQFLKSVACIPEKQTKKSEIECRKVSSSSEQVETSTTASKCFLAKYQNAVSQPLARYYARNPTSNMNSLNVDVTTNEQNKPDKVDISTYIFSNTSLQQSPLPSQSTLNMLHKRIETLERKILRQERVFRSIDPNMHLSSSDEESKGFAMRNISGTAHPGCSYIQQYSHIPETSAFQRYNQQQTAPLSPSKAATLEKEHNSEQYGRDFTTYDGITARGRRQCASVPCKREDVPKMAAERVHKIRHKLNPVRDYRLMDTVHYLAQGEFAPRDDGIKLTPSREGVLSDIIWEDVCRTHWPNARLGRRLPHTDRYNMRCELQRLIDSLLRERVAHVERRKRRHYRIVKLNHRHENCRPVGKTGDIIVASHKDRHEENKEAALSDYNTGGTSNLERHRENGNTRKSHRSHDRLTFQDTRQRRHMREEECVAGPSYAAHRTSNNREATCCYHTSSPTKLDRGTAPTTSTRGNIINNLTSASSISTNKYQSRNPRLVVKKEASRRKYQSKDEPDLEHYILLPTLVVRTPSNVKRQKKFNELYHRILNVQLKNADTNADRQQSQNNNEKPSTKADVNINTVLSDSSDRYFNFSELYESVTVHQKTRVQRNEDDVKSITPFQDVQELHGTALIYSMTTELNTDVKITNIHFNNSVSALPEEQKKLWILRNYKPIDINDWTIDTDIFKGQNLYLPLQKTNLDFKPTDTMAHAVTSYEDKVEQPMTPAFNFSRKLDIPGLVDMAKYVARGLETKFDMLKKFNETFEYLLRQQSNITTTDSPTTDTPSTSTVSTINFDDAHLVAKCFVCGLDEQGIPISSACADAFSGDFIPLVKVDPKARGQLASYRKYCRYLDVPNYLETPDEPQSQFGRFTGGCSVRWVDLTGVYSQRTCRNRRRAVTGKHFGSKRMAKLEMTLSDLEDGCIISPMATLLPVTRSISLYARFHACVLLGNISAAQLRQWARGGAANRLERAVLAGQGRRLLSEAEALPLSHHLPTLVAKCDALHAAVERGSLSELQPDSKK